MEDEAGENADAAAPCPEPGQREHQRLVRPQADQGQRREGKESANNHRFGADAVAEGAEDGLEEHLRDVVQRKEDAQIKQCEADVSTLGT
jgi:hypothetical protein